MLPEIFGLRKALGQAVLLQLSKLLWRQSRATRNDRHRVRVDRVVPWNRNDSFSIRHNDMLALPHYSKPGFLQCANRALVRDSRDSHALVLEDDFALFPVRRELFGNGHILANGIANIVERFFFALALRSAAGQAGDPHAEALVRLLQRNCIASFHNHPPIQGNSERRVAPSLVNDRLRP